MNSGNRGSVLAFMGSPRRGGNTDVLVDEALRGAAAAGARVEKVVLVEHDIQPCRGCAECQETGACVIEDDMRGLLVKMEEADAWILGTPVYWWGPTAQYKAFLDRWFGAGRVVNFKRHRVGLIIPLGDNNEETAKWTVGMLRTGLGYLGVEVVATLLAAGVYRLGEAAKKDALMADAFVMGGKLAAG
ncbi:NAD(P)H-dependent oxidoreductase [bacterium]|nr:NAD(P)H-dependent oxidoreductase [candidate division CSSED10-310 bacterium]